MEIIVCLVILIATWYVWYKWKNEYPENPPKAFWTFLFGWIYLLYYWCNKKGI